MPGDLKVLVDLATNLPPVDIAKLVSALQSGPESVIGLRADSVGALREACSALLEVCMRVSTLEISGVLQGAMKVSERLRDRIDLVWTGPDVPGSFYRLTSAVVADLVDQALTEVLLISYAMYYESALTAAIERALARGVFVQILYERNQDNPSYKGDYVPFAGMNLRRLCWPIDQRPPGASMHAKALVIDRKVALIGSANITGPAMQKNIECGVLLRDPDTAAEIVASVESLVARQVLEECYG